MKRRIARRWLGLALAGTLALGSLPAAIAAGTEYSGEEPSAEGTASYAGEIVLPSAVEAANDPVLDITIPQSGQIVVNPYRMPISTSFGTCDEAVVGEAQPIISYSNIPVSLTVNAVGAFQSGSNAQVVTAPPAENAQEKELFVYFEFWDTDTQSAPWSGTYTGADNQVIVNGEPKDVLKLPAPEEGSASVGCFRAFGSASTPGSVMWNENDTIHITLSFSFAGVILAEYYYAPPVSETPVELPVLDSAQDTTNLYDTVPATTEASIETSTETSSEDSPLTDAPLPDVPSVDASSVDWSGIDIPTVNIPTIEVPVVDLPTVNIPIVDVPTADLSTADTDMDTSTDNADNTDNTAVMDADALITDADMSSSGDSGEMINYADSSNIANTVSDEAPIPDALLPSVDDDEPIPDWELELYAAE